MNKMDDSASIMTCMSLNKIEEFMEDNYDGLLKVYIEQKKHTNKLGVLLTILDKEKSQNTSYYPISSDMFTDMFTD